MRKLKLVKFLTALAIVLALGAFVSPAKADGVIPWTGHGSDELPCLTGGHWVLAPSFGIDSATLTVNGINYAMTQNGSGSWSADSSGPLDVNLTAFVSYTGPGDERDHLQLSHCTEGEPPTATSTSTSEPTATSTSTTEPTDTPTSTSEPTATSTSTTEPTDTPTSTSEPTATSTSTTVTSTPRVVTVIPPTATQPSGGCIAHGPNALYQLNVVGEPHQKLILGLSNGQVQDLELNDAGQFVTGLPADGQWAVKVSSVTDKLGRPIVVTTDDGLGLPTSASPCTARTIFVALTVQPTEQPVHPTGSGGQDDSGATIVIFVVLTAIVLGVAIMVGRRRQF